MNYPGAPCSIKSDLSRPLSNNEGDQAQKCLRVIENEGDMEIKYKRHTKFAILVFLVVFLSCFP